MRGEEGKNMATQRISVPGRARRRKNKIQRFGVFDFFLLVLLSLFGLIILYPFYNTILVSMCRRRSTPGRP